MKALDRGPLVSVVIPVYNGAGSVGRAIRSALTQTYPRVQVIVVDDGSTDDTPRILEGMKSGIAVIRQPNRGETAARNRGVSAADGEYLAFLDHDDYWEPQFLSACVDLLEREPQLVAASAGSEHRSALDGNSHVMPAFLSAPSVSSRAPVVLDDFFSFWSVHDHVCVGAVVMRRSAFLAVGGQREGLVVSGDLEFWACLAAEGGYGFVPEVLLHVDGTQVPRGHLFEKYKARYAAAPTVTEWERRIVPRLAQTMVPSYKKVRGRVATWLIFAKVFAGRDSEAFCEAQLYGEELEGKWGVLWRRTAAWGRMPWWIVASAVRARTRLQYAWRERRQPEARRERE